MNRANKRRPARCDIHLDSSNRGVRSPGAGFVGCCNPVDLDLLPDGRFLTSEKIFVRVKVYDEEGEFLGLVADEAMLYPDMPPTSAVPEARAEALPPEESYDVSQEKFIRTAVDPNGRVYVLDLESQVIAVFEERSPGEAVPTS